MAGETEWGNKQNQYSTSATYSLVFICLSPSSQGVLCFGHSLLGSVKLISLAVQLEKQKKGRILAWGNNPSCFHMDRLSSLRSSFLPPHCWGPAHGLRPQNHGWFCPYLHQRCVQLGTSTDAGLTVDCKTKDETAGSGPEVFLVYGIQAGSALSEEMI